MTDDIECFLAGIGQRSTHTVSAYRRDLLALANHAAEGGLRDWAEIDTGHLSGFIAICHRRGLGGRSLQRRLSAIRAFYRHLERAGRVSRNPAEGLRAPKAQKRLPEVLDVDQSARLMGIPGTDPLAVRDRALLELVYSSGLRVSEAVGLDLADLDLVEREVRVTGKGNKRRIVPVGRYAVETMQTWLPVRAERTRPEERAVFVGRRGERLSVRAVQKRMYEWGIPSGTRPARPPPYAPAFLREPSPRILGRFARRPGAPGPRRHRHHPGLHPPRLPAPGQSLRRDPPESRPSARPKRHEARPRAPVAGEGPPAVTGPVLSAPHPLAQHYSPSWQERAFVFCTLGPVFGVANDS